MTEISLIVTLNNQFTFTILHFIDMIENLLPGKRNLQGCYF